MAENLTGILRRTPGVAALLTLLALLGLPVAFVLRDPPDLPALSDLSERPATSSPSARVAAAHVPASAPGVAARDDAGRAPGLLWHVAGTDGSALDSRGRDEPINPASVVKVATTLWAIEQLGSGHRFATGFAIRGELDAASGVLDGDLLVRGGGDPDFHVENAYLVAAALNRSGLREVSGSLLVDDRFWIGWEGGSERRERDADARVVQMATRLRDALDPARWTSATRRAVRELASRRPLPATHPRVIVRGGVGRLEDDGSGATELVRHRSNPLVATLKRFNSFSNNDIERFGPTLGPPAELARWLADRWGLPPAEVRFATLSGLGSNRMTPGLVVRLLEDLRATCAARKIEVRDLLPVAGCDPGTLESFAAFGDGAADLVGKTGTLTRTDGGVAVLAGFLGTGQGDLTFCVVEPRSGPRPAQARHRQQDWVLDLMGRHGGGRPATCGAPLPYSDDDVEVTRAR